MELCELREGFSGHRYRMPCRDCSIFEQDGEHRCAFVDITSHVAYHARLNLLAGKTAGGKDVVRGWELGSRFRGRGSTLLCGANRQLPMRARSSTGWVAGAARYDSGLSAHKC